MVENIKNYLFSVHLFVFLNNWRIFLNKGKEIPQALLTPQRIKDLNSSPTSKFYSKGHLGFGFSTVYSPCNGGFLNFIIIIFLIFIFFVLYSVPPYCISSFFTFLSPSALLWH